MRLSDFAHNNKRKEPENPLYVVADASDNSITFSSELFTLLGGMDMKKAKVFMFYIPEEKAYGFTLRPKQKVKAELYDIQYNYRYKEAGFVTSIPTVNRILYDYNIPDAKGGVVLPIEVCEAQKMEYYKMCRPGDKAI